MRYGRSVPDGWLPVFSVDTEDEARKLLVSSCGTTVNGEFFASELVERQTLFNLAAFSQRLYERAKQLHLIDPEM